MPVQLRIQPTLFIFMGTSSGEIGWRLKKLLYEAYGDVPILKFLWIDLDSDITPEAKPWFKSAERVDLTGVNAALVAKNVENYPYIHAWWSGTANIPPGSILHGAQNQMRLIGRLSLFRKFDDRIRGEAVIDKLTQAIQSMFEIENHHRTVAMSNERFIYTVEQGCRVIMIYSPCGGTGSSIAFDVAYLCRHMLEEQNPMIISINILPQVIDKAITAEAKPQKEKIRANAYAWFKEDNYLIENPYWRVAYPELEEIEVDAQPFDFRYVMDIQNQAGYRLNNFNDVCDMVAQAVFLDTGSSIGGAMRGFAVIVAGLGETFLGRRRAYSSLAAASLIYPKARLLNYCSNRLAQALLDDGMLASPQDDEVNVSTSALISQLNLRDKDLLRLLIEGIYIKISQEPAVKKTETVDSAKSLIDSQEAQNREARRVVEDQVKEKSQAVLTKIIDDLQKEIAKIAAVKGFNFAHAVLERMLRASPAGQVDPQTTSLDALRTRIQQVGLSESDVKEARDEFDRSIKSLKSLDDGPEDKIERLVNNRGWKKKFGVYKNDCINSMRRMNETSIQIAAQQEADAIYIQIANFVSTLKDRLKSSVNLIEKISVEYQEAARNEAERNETQAIGYEFLREIPVDFPAYYAERAGSINPSAIFSLTVPVAAADSYDSLERWINGRLKDDAKKYAEKFFIHNLENISILEAIRLIAEKNGENAQGLIQKYMDDIFQYCHPFWQYDQNKGLHDIEGKSLIGVEDENNPLIPEAYRDNRLFEIKTTGLRDRIDVVRVWHGLPAFLLRGMKEYKVVYERKRKGQDPLHVLPGMEFAQDVFPEEGQQYRETFAVAFPFNFIVNSGSYFYYDPERRQTSHQIPPGREFRLAQGREKAEDVFARRADWAQEVADKIEKEIREMGNQKAIDLLETAIRAHLETIAKMSAEDTLRRQYDKEVRALRNMQRRLGKVT